MDSLLGLCIPFEPFSVLAITSSQFFLTLHPPLGISMSFTWTWRRNGNSMHEYKLTSIDLFISGSQTIYTRSMDVGKQIVDADHRSDAFGKAYRLGRFFL